MLFRLAIPLLFSTLTFANPILFPRQTNSTTQLINQIGIIERDIARLNTTLNSFLPDAVLEAGDAFLIQFQTGNLEDDLNGATSIINSALPFNDEDSGTIATAVLGLEPQIASLLNNIVVHKPSFASVLVSYPVHHGVSAHFLSLSGHFWYHFGKAAPRSGTFNQFARQSLIWCTTVHPRPDQDG